MYHYVFGAAINSSANKKSIEIAKSVVKHLEEQWELAADIVLCNYHSKITIVESCDNIEIKFDNNDTTQLINDCMEFARLQERYKEN